MTSLKATLRAFGILVFVFAATQLLGEDENKSQKDEAANAKAEQNETGQGSEANIETVQLVPDPQLQKVILEIKRRRQVEGEEITMDDLKNVWSLDANRKGIRDLTGLEHCINLGDAKLAGNEIVDVTPLKSCGSLQLLDLASNQVKDPSCLGDLKKLQYLNLENNQVTSLDGLENCLALNSLYAAGNEIVAIEPVAALQKLWSLDLSRNKIEDITPVAELKRLSQLGLAGNQISDISSIPAGNGMYSTYLSGNKIVDIGPLVELAMTDAEGPRRFASFWRLYLEDNPLSEESKSKGLESLRKAGVRLNPEKS